MRADYRYERVEADLPAARWCAPSARRQPSGRIDLGLRSGNLSLLSFAFERDTRADPVLTPAGSRLVHRERVRLGAFGSSWDFFKLTVTYQQWLRLRWGHVLSFGALAGFIVGDAPIFERYFLGDLDPLLPSHALGLTVSTLAPRNLLQSGIARERYAPLAARLMVEYAIPLFRGGPPGLRRRRRSSTSGWCRWPPSDDLRGAPGRGWQAVPMDLLVDVGLRLDTVIGTFTSASATRWGGCRGEGAHPLLCCSGACARGAKPPPAGAAGPLRHRQRAAVAVAATSSIWSTTRSAASSTAAWRPRW